MKQILFLSLGLLCAPICAAPTPGETAARVARQFLSTDPLCYKPEGFGGSAMFAYAFQSGVNHGLLDAGLDATRPANAVIRDFIRAVPRPAKPHPRLLATADDFIHAEI